MKIRQPDSGQLIDGNISRIIDSSVYTVGELRMRFFQRRTKYFCYILPGFVMIDSVKSHKHITLAVLQLTNDCLKRPLMPFLTLLYSEMNAVLLPNWKLVDQMSDPNRVLHMNSMFLKL